MIDRENPYLKYVFEAAGDISDANESSIIPATPVASTVTARVTQHALYILVVHHKTNLRRTHVCCKDMYVNGA